MEHISNLNAGVYTSIAKRLGMTDIGNHSAHGFVGNICENGFAVHLHNCMGVRCFKGITLENIPSFSITVNRFVNGKVANQLNIDVWEYSDISKAIDAVKNFIG